ncbi:MAG TPA: hypothetical protein VKV19_20145 [Ktedonobacteraceae bacterium]|nr:hypothetical protein [Ktedonobacteraceae bacterium]
MSAKLRGTTLFGSVDLCRKAENSRSGSMPTRGSLRYFSYPLTEANRGHLRSFDVQSNKFKGQLRGELRQAYGRAGLQPVTFSL